ncbi:alpha/beta fold hydrolase [Altererythrobacter sp. MF3-039]|uniref:alpha/beta fold hydrolase n=1 Tax=Altererythrobacter sp. MF3-039 TaxID=3252901 RepID=UPI00390CC540
MLKKVLIVLAVLVTAGAVFAFAITRDGDVTTPQGEGTVSIASGDFEGFSLPEYAASFVNDDYKSYFVEVEPGIKIHVLEVGEGFTVYMQHGNPTSGFLYRKVAAELPKDQLRLVMPTMVGLGYSSKVSADQHTLENHMRWMTAALEQIGVTEAVYVGQDWGGPVGMGAMARSPGVLKGAVVMNTGFTAPREARDLSEAHAMVKTPVVGEMALEVFGSIFDRLPGAQGDPTSMPSAVLDLYGKPVTESGNAKAPVALMRMVPDSPDHPSAEQMREIEAYVATLDIPVELVWGMNDPILGPGLATMQANFPKAPVTETEAGHFLQEEVPEEIAAAILRVVDRVQGADAGRVDSDD